MRRAGAGFTLLELLIAIALFALLGLATWRMLDTLLRSDEALRVQEMQLRQFARALWLLERDLLQAVPRPVRDGYGDEQIAFIGQLADVQGLPALELTRSGWRNPTALQRSSLQRVQWRLSGDCLERLYWVVLDRDVSSEARVQAALDGVSEWRLRYLDETRQWHDEWPPFEFGRGDLTLASRRLPAAVEVSFEHVRHGRIQRLLRLTGSAPSAPAFDSQGEPGAEGGGLP